jgi:N-acetylglucosamine-6-phosphate deacetylase
MILKNARVFNEDFNIIHADIAVNDDKISAIAEKLDGNGPVYNLDDCLIVPGFIDIHIHGCVGSDTCDGTRKALSEMAKHLITKGVTSFCPTTMTVSFEKITAALSAAGECMKNPPDGAAICGVNMEGPYISVHKRGAQKEEFVRKPNWSEFDNLYKNCGGIIKLVDIAPECEGAAQFIAQASKLCRVSLAHTEADYDRTKNAFCEGISHVTHLFNAMTGFNHRMPGAVGAVFDDDRVKAEIICDGFHIHPVVLRTVFRILGEDRTVIVSDSMRAAGQPDGISELGGQTVYIKDGQARLADGTIAGSTTNIYQEVKNLLDFGVPLKQAIKSATINPAIEIGEDDKIGSVKVGKIADMVAFDQDYNIRLVVAKGKVMVSPSF